MSAQFFQSSTPQENQSIKCNDLTVRGSMVANEAVTVAGGLSTNSQLSFLSNSDPSRSGKIVLPALTSYAQGTSTATTVVVSGNEQQFKISTFETSPGVGGDILAGAGVSFDVTHSGIVAGKTIVLCAKAGSYNDNANVNAYVGASTNGRFSVTRRNFGATTASGTEEILVKLLQSA